MHSINCSFRTLSRSVWIGRAYVLCVPLFLIAFTFIACTNTEDFANPLDSDNLRTAGAPEGLTLYPGDRQIRVTWIDTGKEGIKAYKIYRRSKNNSDEPFVLVGTVDAPANEFVDSQGIENDRRDSFGGILAYEYRISYVDMNDVETPDPTNPPGSTEDPLRLWQTVSVTPSIAPPAPEVTIGDPQDLTVSLFWENYEFPSDFYVFRIYMAKDEGEGKTPVFQKIADIERDQLHYFDLNFRQDNMNRIYHVAAVDEFGVEAITVVRASSPNLPPKPPKNFHAQYFRRSLFNTQYDVVLTWDANTESDLAGYQIYTKDAEDNILPRQKARARETSLTIVGESPIVIDQDRFYRSFFITAIDDTPGLGGKPDESEMVEAIPHY